VFKALLVGAQSPTGVASPELDAMSSSAVPNTNIPVDAPTCEEVRRAILKLKNGRAPGADGLSPELLKCAVDSVVEPLLKIFHFVWKTGIVPADWRDGIIVSLYKGKGPRTECKSHQSHYSQFLARSLPTYCSPALNHCCTENVAYSNLVLPRTDPHWTQYLHFACYQRSIGSFRSLCMQPISI